MSLQRLWAITRKEIRHIMRDRTTLLLVTLMPSLLLFLMAYAVTAEIDHVPIGVLDLDRSPTSRAFIQQVTVGPDLILYDQVFAVKEIDDLLARGRIKAAVLIPSGFENQLLTLNGMPLQVLVDGTEPQSGGFAVDRIGRRAEAFATQLLGGRLRSLGLNQSALQPVDLRVRTWYNPGLKPRADLIPGLVSLVLGVPGMSVALTLAREREHGTLEQILVSPIGRAELLVGKMGPYVISGLVNVLLTVALAIVWFEVPFHGNIGLYLLLSACFFFALLSLGMLVGVFIRTQAAALALTFLVIFFPGFFLTGIFFPIASMPALVREEAMAFPGTHFAIITRAQFITGLGLEVLWPYAMALLAMGVGYTFLAALFFRKKLR